ncbi:MAG: hypothetical protein HY698_01920 [Deltaproteobacteria bacterium]|nr:hypothetical protein [Deltaproteobacteria bacterium]
MKQFSSQSFRQSLGINWTVVGLAAVASLSCSSREPAPVTPVATSMQGIISDEAHSSGQVGFFWLPPLATPPALQGAFDATQKPVVTITPLTPGANPIAMFTTSSGPGSETVRVDPVAQQYIVNWHTDRFSLDPNLHYRISVLIDGRVTGFLDVDVVTSQKQAKNVDASEYTPLVDGRTLPIKWWMNVCGSTFCTAQDACHTAGVCDYRTGACSNPVAPDGTGCDDGNACTQADACQAGSCQSGVPVECVAEDVCHDPGVCEPRTGQCSTPAKPDGTACVDDGDCTTNDVCQSGSCTHSTRPSVCDASCPARGVGLVCQEKGTDCRTDSPTCTTHQSIVPGVPEPQTLAQSEVAVDVAPSTVVTIDGVPATAPVPLSVGVDYQPDLAGADLPSTSTVIRPVFRFEPSGARFDPPLTVTVATSSVVTRPVFWLCANDFQNCEARPTLVTADPEDPNRILVTASVEHFSTGVLTSATPPQSWDAARDFNATSNPAGAWSYGWASYPSHDFTLHPEHRTDGHSLQIWETSSEPGGYLRTFFNPLDSNRSPADSPSAFLLPHEIGVHPSNTGKWSVIRFTAPKTRTYNVRAVFRTIDENSGLPGSGTDGVKAIIRAAGSTTLMQESIWRDDQPVQYSGSVRLTSGQTIDFAVHMNGAYNNDSTAVSARVEIPAESQEDCILNTAATFLGDQARDPLRQLYLYQQKAVGTYDLHFLPGAPSTGDTSAEYATFGMYHFNNHPLFVNVPGKFANSWLGWTCDGTCAPSFYQLSSLFVLPPNPSSCTRTSEDTRFLSYVSPGGNLTLDTTCREYSWCCVRNCDGDRYSCRDSPASLSHSDALVKCALSMAAIECAPNGVTTIAASWPDSSSILRAGFGPTSRSACQLDPTPPLSDLPPSTCANILETWPTAPDNDYTLYHAFDLNRPWTAYCRGMASGSPAEYLTVNGTTNYSRYAAGGASPGTDVVTRYQRVRIIPWFLMVDGNDRTYSTSSGSLLHGSVTPVTSMPYGTAMDCKGSLSQAGTAVLDLRGTQFVVAPDQFLPQGFQAAGSTLYGSTDTYLTTYDIGRRVGLYGGGYCGWTSVAGANPLSERNLIQLRYLR